MEPSSQINSMTSTFSKTNSDFSEEEIKKLTNWSYIMTKLKSETDVVFVKPTPVHIPQQNKLPDFYKLFPFHKMHLWKITLVNPTEQ